MDDWKAESKFLAILRFLREVSIPLMKVIMRFKHDELVAKLGLTL